LFAAASQRKTASLLDALDLEYPRLSLHQGQSLSNKHRKSCLHIDLNEIDEPKAVQIISSWIELRGIKTLNVAGPKASRDPHIYDATVRILGHVFQAPPERILSKWPKTVEAHVERVI